MVVIHAVPRPLDEHEQASHAAVARTLARIKRLRFAGAYDPAVHRPPLYFVPSDTLSMGDARRLGIVSHDDLFGGVVPRPFVAGKGIVHPLVAARARAPEGWSHEFAERVRDVVLPGYSAFTLEEARLAAKRLLDEGPVRLKPAECLGGAGQAIVSDEAGLDAALAGIDGDALGRCGMAVELDLSGTQTFSVGQVRVGTLVATYCGTQRLTEDNAGNAVFGGSDLRVVRGGWDALWEALGALDLPMDARRAVRNVQAFDAAMACYPGFFASRCNYDAVEGRDAAGRLRLGVLEQSWRIGGASPAEAAALAAFHDDPHLQAVHARCEEAYGTTRAPEGAIVHFSGVDPSVGPLVKFTLVEAYEAAR